MIEIKAGAGVLVLDKPYLVFHVYLFFCDAFFLIILKILTIQLI